jgi:hypothetical protein
MIETDQTIFERGKGNCFEACLASLLEMPIDDVVKIPDGEARNWFRLVNEWLSTLGLFFIEFTADDETTKYWGYHIIIGSSSGSRLERHAVVGYNGEMVFDPHPDRSGLVGDDLTYGFLIPLDPKERRKGL